MKKYYYAILLLLSIFNCYSQDNNIYSMSETRPQPNEGIVTVGKKIAQNIPCLKTGINYFFNFIVEKDGSLSNVTLLRGELDTAIENCNESIQTAFANSPKWIPGKNGNIPVRVQSMIPLKKEMEINVEKDPKNDVSYLNGVKYNEKTESDNEIGSFYFSYERKRKDEYQENSKLDSSNLENSIDENSYWKKNECGLWMVMIGNIHKEGGGYKTFNEWYNDYNKNANKELIGKSILNKPDGEWSYHTNSGRLEAKGNFVNGKPNGKWIYYFYKNNILKSEKIENYKDGVPDGEWFVLVDGIKDEYSIENFVLGKREGLLHIGYEYEDRTSKHRKEYAEINFLRGVPHGYFSAYYMDWNTAKKEIFIEGIYENGILKELTRKPSFYSGREKGREEVENNKVVVSKKIELNKNLNKIQVLTKYKDVYFDGVRSYPNKNLSETIEYEYDKCEIKQDNSMSIKVYSDHIKIF